MSDSDSYDVGREAGERVEAQCHEYKTEQVEDCDIQRCDERCQGLMIGKCYKGREGDDECDSEILPITESRATEYVCNENFQAMR